MNDDNELLELAEARDRLDLQAGWLSELLADGGFAAAYAACEDYGDAEEVALLEEASYESGEMNWLCRDDVAEAEWQEEMTAEWLETSRLRALGLA